MVQFHLSTNNICLFLRQNQQEYLLFSFIFCSEIKEEKGRRWNIPTPRLLCPSTPSLLERPEQRGTGRQADQIKRRRIFRVHPLASTPRTRIPCTPCMHLHQALRRQRRVLRSARHAAQVRRRPRHPRRHRLGRRPRAPRLRRRLRR